MQKRLALARELVMCLGGMDVKLVSDEDLSTAERKQEIFFDSLFTSIIDRDVVMYLAQLEPGRVYFLSGILGLTYILIRIPSQNKYLLAGPCRREDFSEAEVRRALRPYDLSDTRIQQIISYCRWQPALSPEKIFQVGILLGRHVLELPEPVAHQHIEYRWNRSPDPEFMQPEPYMDHSNIRLIEMRYEASAALTEAVKAGNLSLALQMMRSIPGDIPSMHRNPDHLRNAQNMCIILNTQLRHALEERKIHPYRLDMVSGEIARQIELLRTLDDVGKFYPNILRCYCELALEKNYAHLEPLTRQAVIHIKNHLSDNLTVKGTADALQVNANYLSGKFHREVGMTFTDFVNRERTEQAAALLMRTNIQIQQIAAAVGYNNTSYFSKQFLRFQGITPRQYRSARQP